MPRPPTPSTHRDRRTRRRAGAAYSSRVARSPEDDRQRPLAGRRVGRDVAQVVDDEDRRRQRPDRDRRDDEQRLQRGPPAGTRSRRPRRARRTRTRTPRRARDSRTATGRRCRRAPPRPRAAPMTSRIGPPTYVSHSPTMPGQPDRRAPMATSSWRSRDEAGGRDPDRTGPVGRVGALAEVGQVVGEVRGDLEQQRDGEAAERRVEPERRADRERRPEPDDDAAQRRRQRRRPDGQQPDPERPGGGARARRLAGVLRHGRRGNREKSGGRFSRNAANPRAPRRSCSTARSRCPRTPGARPARRWRRGTPT